MPVKEALPQHYWSQCVTHCGDLVDKACGPVSLANMLVLMRVKGLSAVTPRRILKIAVNKNLFDAGGLPPGSLQKLCEDVTSPSGLSAQFHELCRPSDIEAGTLLYVNASALMNVQEGAVQMLESTHDNSHIVMVESVMADATLVVINPDRRRTKKGFTRDMWGRMYVPRVNLENVWRATRFDGTPVVRGAILFEVTSQ